MITASIVLYRSSREEVRTVVGCVEQSSIEQLIVVDNSPTDDLRDFVVGLSQKAVYIFGQGNVGYGAAHNIAMQRAIEQGAKYHVVINPDIHFESGTIEGIAQYMEQNEGVGQLMPKVFYPNGDLQHLCKLLPTPYSLIGRKFLPASWTKGSNYRYEMRKSGYDKVMEVPFLSGCFMFLSVKAIEQVGGFDERFFMYCEDLDLCRRISMSGYKTIFYPECSVVHAHKKESYTSNVMLREHIKSALSYFNKWGWLFDSFRAKRNRSAQRQYK